MNEYDPSFLEIQRILVYVFPLLVLGCAIAMIAKFKGSAAGILGFFGFGLLLLGPFFWLLVHLADVTIWFEYQMVFTISRLVGWVCIFVAILTVSRSSGEVHYSAAAGSPAPGYPAPSYPAPAYPAPAYSSYQPVGVAYPPQRPGWGLAVSWMILSGLAWVAGFVMLGLVIDAGSRISNREGEEIAVVAIFYVVLLIPAVIIHFIWLYKAWCAVPPEFRSASPGQAIGFLFIPFFNYYWIFRAFPGLSASTRRAQNAYDGRLSSGAGYGMGICACVVLLIPYVNLIAWPFVLIWVILANAEKNRMLNSMQAPAQAPVGQPPPQYPE